MSTQAISALNEKIQSKTNGDHGPRHAARNSKPEIDAVAKSLADMDSGSEQAAALSLTEHCALQPVLDRLDQSELLVNFADWKTGRIEDEFTSRQILELLRFMRDTQGWASKMTKTPRAHMLRTGYAGNQADDTKDGVEDGVYHSFETSYLGILRPELAVDCQEDDSRWEKNNWRSGSDADCEADMSDVDATESSGSDTSENSGSDDADSAADATESTGTAEVGAMMQKLIDKRIDERIDNVDGPDCDCDSVTEERIREIVREEVKDLLGDLV